MQIYSPAQISSTFAEVRTVEQALQTHSPSLLSLTRREGVSRRAVQTLVKLHLVALDAFLKQKNGLTVDEIELIAEEVMEKYGWVLTMADVFLIFRNAKVGRYGELYNQLTCAKVIRWFDDYATERCNTAEQMSRVDDEHRAADYHVPEGFSLADLGYTQDKDGFWRVDPAKVEARNAAKAQAEAERKASEEAEAARRLQGAQEYLRWKEYYRQQSIEQDKERLRQQAIQQQNNPQNPMKDEQE